MGVNDSLSKQKLSILREKYQVSIHEDHLPKLRKRFKIS